MLYPILIVAGFIIDRLSKIYAQNNFIKNPLDFNLIKLVYVENRGAAFGILQNHRMFFVIITIVFTTMLFAYFFKTFKTNSFFLNTALSLIISGALGNFYDRIFIGYVVDFIQVDLIKSIDFPVFNVADSLVCIGCFLVIVDTLRKK